MLDDDADYLGPFSSRKTAEKCLAALHDTFPVRQCSDRLGRGAVARAVRARRDGPLPLAVRRQRRRRRRTPRWCASCATRLLRRPDEVVEAINARMDALAADERFEEAGVHRDRLAAFVRAAARTQRLTALTRCPEVVAARREDDGRWAVHVVRYGRLAAAGVIPPGADAHAVRRRAARRPPRPSAPAPGPVPGRDRRGDREGPALAGVRRASASSTSTASGPARSPAPPGTSPSTTRSTSPGARWCRSTTAATSRPCTSPRALAMLAP